MLRIIVKNSQCNEPSLLPELAAEYREFKDKNPDTCNRSAKKVREALEVMPASMADVPPPIPAPLPNIEQDWVRIRIGGREIEVAKKDFWSLLQSK